MPVHPEAQQLLALLAEAGTPPLEELAVPDARAAARNFVELQGEPKRMRTENRSIPGPGGDIPVRIYRPQDQDGDANAGGNGMPPCIVYFHGGGWVIGDLEVVDRPCRELAAATGAVVVSVDYRLAPEHRYPAAFDDCYAATSWVANNASDLGVDSNRLVVAGDSAGGNLAAAVALAARDRGGPPLAAQLLLYPVTNFAFDTESYQENREGYLLQKSSMVWFWGHYLGASRAGTEPYASPARAESLANLPPAYVATCEYDPLRDEGEAYARRLRESGVSVTARRFDGHLHGFLWMQAAVPSTASVFDDISRVLREAFAGIDTA